MSVNEDRIKRIVTYVFEQIDLGFWKTLPKSKTITQEDIEDIKKGLLSEKECMDVMLREFRK